MTTTSTRMWLLICLFILKENNATSSWTFRTNQTFETKKKSEDGVCYFIVTQWTKFLTLLLFSSLPVPLWKRRLQPEWVVTNHLIAYGPRAPFVLQINFCSHALFLKRLSLPTCIRTSHNIEAVKSFMRNQTILNFTQTPYETKLNTIFNVPLEIARNNNPAVNKKKRAKIPATQLFLTLCDIPPQICLWPQWCRFIRICTCHFNLKPSFFRFDLREGVA